MSVERKDVEMSPELKAKIERFMAIEPDATFKYVPKVYRSNNVPKELWPVFVLRGLDGVESTLNEDRMEISYQTDGEKVKGSTMKINAGEVKVQTCRKGIITWRNLRNQSGKLIPEPKRDDINGLMESSLRMLSPSLITELANAISEQSRLTPEEEVGLE